MIFVMKVVCFLRVQKVFFWMSKYKHDVMRRDFRVKKENEICYFLYIQTLYLIYVLSYCNVTLM